MGSDTRIGKRFLFPGIGYGGSCFPKDVKALAKTSAEYDYDFKILNSVMDVNSLQKHILVQKVSTYFGDDLNGKKLGLWGLSFKPETDDIREAPALTIIDSLLDAGAEILAYDPEAIENVQKIYGDRIQYTTDAYQALDDIDALLILTEWSVFRTPNFSEMKKRMKDLVIFDGRNVYDLHSIKNQGILLFQYWTTNYSR